MKIVMNNDGNITVTAENVTENKLLFKLGTEVKVKDVAVTTETATPRRKYRKTQYKKPCAFCGKKFKGVKLHIAKAHKKQVSDYLNPQKLHVKSF